MCIVVFIKISTVFKTLQQETLTTNPIPTKIFLPHDGTPGLYFLVCVKMCPQLFLQDGTSSWRCCLSSEASPSLSLAHLLCPVGPQIIQRQLEQVEEKQRQLEERGVAVEKALRGEAGTIRAPSEEVILKEGPPDPAGG